MLRAVGLATTPRKLNKAAEMVCLEHQARASRENIGKLRAQREKTPRMPSGEVQNYSYIQRRPLRIIPLRACVMRHRTSPSGKNSAAHQRAQKIWMRCSNAGKLQQPLVSCEIVPRSLEILPRRPSDEAKNCASPCGGNVSKTHGLGKKIACSKLVRRETQLRPVEGGRVSHAGRMR